MGGVTCREMLITQIKRSCRKVTSMSETTDAKHSIELHEPACSCTHSIRGVYYIFLVLLYQQANRKKHSETSKVSSPL